MDNKKLTAVDWLEEALAENLKQIIVNSDSALMESLFAKAKAMQKEQIKIAYDDGYKNGGDDWGEGSDKTSEQYYTETYEK